MLTAQGHEVLSPARADIAHYGVEFASLSTTGSEDFAAEQYGFSRREALREDLSWICAHADAVALLPGWRASTGATAEHATALALNLLIIEL